MFCLSTWLLRRLKMKESSEIKIWRYLSLPKFVDFILNESVSLSRVDTFSDKKEGISNELITLINIYKAEKEKYSDNNSHFPFVGISNPIDGLVLHSLSNEEKDNLKKLIADQKKYFISSWFISEHESMAMWDLYSKSDGVALLTTVNTIEKAIKKSNPFFDNGNLKHQKISYNNITKITDEHFSTKSDMFDLLFRKDISFKHENEYRFALFEKDGENQIPNKQIKLVEKTINEFKIIAHPLMPSWQFENIIKLCGQKILKENIIKSRLT